jgi:superkiller protein 3
MPGLKYQSGTFIAITSVASVLTFVGAYLIFARTLTGAPIPPQISRQIIERSLERANESLLASDYAKSESLARETLKHSPSNVSAYNMLGLALKKQGRLDEAVAAYERAIGLMPSHHEARNNLAVALEAMGRTREAEGAYLRALRDRPGAPATHLNYALLLETEGRNEEALAHYYAFLGLSQNSKDSHNSQNRELSALVKSRIEALK